MKPEDWVRILTLLASIVLFYGSLRAQKWTKTQTDIQARAQKALLERMKKASQSNVAKSAEEKSFDELAAEIIARPVFDKFAYVLLCAGFAVTSFASLIDIWSHREWITAIF